MRNEHVFMALFLVVGLALSPGGTSDCDAASFERPLASQPVQESPIPPARMRGVNVPIHGVDVALVERLAKWGCNAMRINFDRDDPADKTNPPTEEYPLAPYAKNLARLDAVLPTCQKLNVKIILCASGIYGRKFEGFWSQADEGQVHRQYLLGFWKAFAKRYKGNPAIVAYDVMNEPHYKAKDRNIWLKHLLPDAVAAIRSINPDIWLVIEPGPWNGPSNYVDLPLPVNDPHIIYSIHMYAPHMYTHQGIHGNPLNQVYPGVLKMFDTSEPKQWDKATLKETIQPAIDFAHKYHVRMFVGEFGVARWAPGRAQWVKDCTSIFEAEGFDWMYHSLAGWNGWNPTFAPDARKANPVGRDSDGGYRDKVMRTLLKGWGLSKKEMAVK